MSDALGAEPEVSPVWRQSFRGHGPVEPRMAMDADKKGRPEPPFPSTRCVNQWALSA